MALALLSAKIYTGDPARPWAEAVGIETGRITAVGANAEVLSALTGKVETFELPGRLVTPGLVDGHCHFLNYGLYLRRVDLRPAPEGADLEREPCPRASRRSGRLRRKGPPTARRPI